MGKILFTQNFDATKAEQSLKELKNPAGALDFLTYSANAFNNILRIMINGLSYADNFDCELKQVALKSGIETVVSTSQRKRAQEVRVRRVVSDTYYQWTAFGWKYNPAGEIVVKIDFAGSPPALLDVPLELIILYG